MPTVADNVPAPVCVTLEVVVVVVSAVTVK